MTAKIIKVKIGVPGIKGWRFNERKGIHNVVKYESALGDKNGMTSRYDTVSFVKYLESLGFKRG